MDIKNFEFLHYRIQSVAIGHLAILYVLEWNNVPSVKIFFGEEQVIEGRATAFTNAAIEAALIHCRALLEFLGLAAGDEKTLKQRKGVRNDDIVIEDFEGPSGPLKKVTPIEASRPYEGSPQEAETALAYVLHTTNKALAHSTRGFSKSNEASRLIEIAFRGVPTLMVNYFYNRMGIEAPKYKLPVRSRNV
ncbi:MAG: hypothetical protein GXO95_00815 [Nitrospirae bacterium]|nr:hypothetical protein [Nitrospirota bacterium]